MQTRSLPLISALFGVSLFVPGALFSDEPENERQDAASTFFLQELANDDLKFFPLADPNDPDEAKPSAECSRWASFPVGSWARIRTTNVVYENGRELQNSMETKLTLKSVDPIAGRYELQCDSTIKLGGLERQTRSECLQYDFLDLPYNSESTIEETAPETLTIGGKAIPCRTRRIITELGNERTTTRVWYSKKTAPYVVQIATTREPVNRDKNRKKPTSIARELSVAQETSENKRFGIEPFYYTTESSSLSEQRAQRTTTKSSLSIPGGILRQTTIETDPNDGSETCRTTKKLLDYYIADK